MPRRTAVKLAIVLIILLAGGMGVYYWYFFGRDGKKTGGEDTAVFPVGLARPIEPAADGEEVTEPSRPAAKLSRLSEKAIVSAVLIRRDGTTVVRYLERGTGHIYDQPLGGREERVSITTIPRIFEALWSPDGVFLVLSMVRSNLTAETLYGRIVPQADESGVGRLDTSPLFSNTETTAISPSGSQLLSLSATLSGSNVVVSKPDGTGRTIWHLPLLEWIVEWPKEETVTLTSKAAAGLPGSLYFLNIKTGNIERKISGVAGLTTRTNKTSTLVLWGESGESLVTRITNLVTKAEKDLPFRTLPEKCTWSRINTSILFCAVPEELPAAAYPDAWYEGRVSFRDKLVSFDFETEELTVLAAPADEARSTVDAVNLSLDAAEEVLVFKNKTDSSLWAVALSD